MTKNNAHRPPIARDILNIAQDAETTHPAPEPAAPNAAESIQGKRIRHWLAIRCLNAVTAVLRALTGLVRMDRIT